MTEVEILQDDVFDLLPELPGGYGQAAVVDYPWEFDTRNGTDRFGHNQLTGEDDLYVLEDNAGLSGVLEHLPRVVEDGGWVFVFADDDTLPEFRGYVEDQDGLDYKRTWIWDRVNFGMGTYGRVQDLRIVTATVGKTDRYVRDRGTVLQAKKTGVDSDYHTAKPVDLYRQMLDAPVLRDGERLLEPFFGTAPGLAVCYERGLDYWGADVSDEAHDRAEERVANTAVTEF